MITIVVGGQFGGEGKGKVASYLAARGRVDIACRCGGPNSSHTVVWEGRKYRLRMLPAAVVVNPKVTVFFGAGTLIHIRTLMNEISQTGFRGKLVIDRQAGIVTDEIVEQQRKDSRYEGIGSTLTGTGYASAMRCLRNLRLAHEFPELRAWAHDLRPFVMEALANRSHILLEGHQGYGLSNYHGDYPYVSSRDSTAASMLAELGLGPVQREMHVVLVVKLFPTRNHRGNLGEEMPDADADILGIKEYGGGSWGIPDRRRRVGYFDYRFLELSAFANSATHIALTGADYYSPSMASRTDVGSVTKDIEEVARMIERHARAPVQYISTGPSAMDMIELCRNAPIRAAAVDPPKKQPQLPLN